MATYVAVFALILAYVALVAAYLALRTLAKLRRATAVLNRGSRGDGQQSLIEATSAHAEITRDVIEELAALRAHVDEQHAIALSAVAERAAAENGALRNVALVRYDAFADLSGRMSFSLAVLDDAGDGVTISALSGRSDTRVYAKSVVAGTGEQELSPEERQAVSSARARMRATESRRTRRAS